jgi:hypothetical protein
MLACDIKQGRLISDFTLPANQKNNQVSRKAYRGFIMFTTIYDILTAKLELPFPTIRHKKQRSTIMNKMLNTYSVTEVKNLGRMVRL